MLVSRIDYKKYNLKNNPFPYIGIPNLSRDKIFVDRLQESEIMSECLTASLKGSSTHLVVVGSYGNGKTTVLQQLQYELCKHDAILPVYISNPGENFKQLYNNLLQSIGLKKFEEIVWKYITIINRDPKLEQKIEKGTILFSEVLERTKKEINASIDYVDFTYAFLNVIFEQTKLLSWRYLSGESLTSEQKKQIDLVSNIDSDEKAVRALTTFKTILQETGIKLLCLLIDELEYIETLPSFKKQRMFTHLRHLIDLNPDGLSIVVCCAPESWNSIIQGYHAFSERISRQIVLQPVSNKVAMELVKCYLSRSRSTSTKDQLYPFTGEAIVSICDTANGNIRRILSMCNQLIDFGSKNNCSMITPKVINKLFET